MRNWSEQEVSRRFVVRAVEKKKAETHATNPDPPFDIGSFFWGLVAGGIITLVAEGALIYVTWPVLVGFVKTVGLAETVKRAL